MVILNVIRETFNNRLLSNLDPTKKASKKIENNAKNVLSLGKNPSMFWVVNFKLEYTVHPTPISKLASAKFQKS